MENIFISNGIMQLVIAPNNEYEEQMFKRFTDQGVLEIQFLSSPIAIVDKSAKNCLIIKPKIVTHAS